VADGKGAALAAARKERGLAELGVWGLAARRASLGVRRSGRLQAPVRHAGRRRRDDQYDDASSTLVVWPQKCWSEARPAGGTASLGSAARVSRAPGSDARQEGGRSCVASLQNRPYGSGVQFEQALFFGLRDDSGKYEGVIAKRPILARSRPYTGRSDGR
jgi:hypothetical protein